MKFTVIRYATAIGFAVLSIFFGNRIGAAFPAKNVYGDYLTATYARDTGDRERAKSSYINLVTKKSDSSHVLEDAFSFFVFNGNIERAVAVGHTLNNLKSDQTFTNKLLALNAFHNRDFIAMENFISSDEDFLFQSLVAPLLRAWTLILQGENEEALKILSLNNELDDFKIFYLENRALILAHLGRDTQAETAYRKILSQKQTFTMQSVIGLASILQKQGHEASAKNLLEAYHQKNFFNTDLERALNLLSHSNSLDVVFESPERIIARALLFIVAEYGQGLTYFDNLFYVNLALFLDPQWDEANLLAGNLYLENGYPGLAFDSYAKIQTSGSAYETVMLRRALALNALNKFEEAFSIIKQISSSQDVKIIIALGDLYLSHEKYDEALSYFDRAISQIGEPNIQDWYLFFSRGTSLERLGRLSEAETDLKKSLKLKPTEPLVLNYLGYLWIDQGINLKEARELIERAVALSPDAGFILDSLGWAQFKMGEHEKAVESLEAAVVIDPGNPEINDHLGDVYWNVGRRREARFQWQRALVFNPSNVMRDNILLKLNNGFFYKAIDTK